MIVDVHNHYYPPRYLSELERSGSNVHVARDARGRMLVHYPGDYNVVARGHRNLDERIRIMDEHGVTVQAISLTTPGVHVEPRARGIERARLVNDEFADAAARYTGRFAPLAALPLQDPDAATAELERAVTELGLRGALLFSNVNGRYLDEPEFLPLWDKLAELQVPALLHPTNPAAVDAVAPYRLTAIAGFLFDTTTAALRIVFAGIPERLPKLRLIIGHLGGTIPYIVERADRGYEAYDDECRVHITQPPSHYFRRFYYDTVNFNPDALRLALAFAGPDHVVFGSDYPHQVGSVGKALRTLQDLGLGEDERAAMLGRNAAGLLAVEAVVR